MKELLVIVDVQNDFVDGALGTLEAKAIIPNLVEKIRNWEGDFLVTYDTHFNDYLNTHEGKLLPVPHCMIGTEGRALNHEILVALAEAKERTGGPSPWVVTKQTFGTTGIADVVKAYDYEYVEFTGLCTDICVVSNALMLRAAASEIDIAVDASCCAGTSEGKHNAALDVMESCQIEVLNRSEE